MKTSFAKTKQKKKERKETRKKQAKEGARSKHMVTAFYSFSVALRSRTCDNPYLKNRATLKLKSFGPER